MYNLYYLADGYSNIIVNCESDELCSCLIRENQQCACREDAMEEKEDFCEPQSPSQGEGLQSLFV